MRRLLPIILLSAALVIGTWVGLRRERVEPLPGPVLRVEFIDVGQGDSVFIRTPDGVNALVDAGEQEYGPEVVERLRQLGVRRLSLVVMSHPHSDHIGGMPAVFEAFPVDRVLDSGYAHGTDTQERVLNIIDAEGIPYYRARSGTDLTLGRLVRLEVLSPPTELFDGTSSDANNNSVVLRLVFDRVRMLLTGDIETEAVGGLISSRQDLESQVLKVAHHGSSDGTPLELLRLVRPDYAVISVGADNEYGHPHKPVLRRLATERTGAVTVRTDQNGSITVLTDGRKIVVETER
ncbi:MAG: MBL fold metallo-hydrolase [Armatimonadetes bacterium]|nr:MBL fold metallo-hydrolase [Armatimonadota bacterium]